MRQDTQTAADQAGNKLETATRQGNSGDFNKALAEVNDYLRANPGETQDLQSSVAARLNADQILGHVALFEVKSNLDQIAPSCNGAVTKDQVEAYESKDGTNPLERILLAGATDELAKITPILGRRGVPTDRIALCEIDKVMAKLDAKESLDHLFTKAPNGGPSLYERLTDKDGNIPPNCVEDLMIADHTLSDVDMQSLRFLKSKDLDWFRFSEGLSDAQIKQLCQEAGTDFGIKVTAPADSAAPVDATTAPVDTTTAPVDATTAPVDTTTAPADATTAPVDATTAPVDTTTAPTDVTPAPVDATAASADTTAASANQPVNTTEQSDSPVPDPGTMAQMAPPVDNGETPSLAPPPDLPPSLDVAPLGDSSATPSGPRPADTTVPADSTPAVVPTPTASVDATPPTDQTQPFDRTLPMAAAPSTDATPPADSTPIVETTPPVAATPSGDSTPPADSGPSPDTTPLVAAPPSSDVTPSAPADATPPAANTPPSDSTPPADSPAPADSTSTTASTDTSASDDSTPDADMQRQIDAAVTIQRPNESYAHCAERLWTLAGIDPTGQQIRQLSHLLWKSDGSKPAGALRLHEQLQIDNTVIHALKTAHGSKF